MEKEEKRRRSKGKKIKKPRGRTGEGRKKGEHHHKDQETSNSTFSFKHHSINLPYILTLPNSAQNLSLPIITIESQFSPMQLIGLKHPTKP